MTFRLTCPYVSRCFARTHSHTHTHACAHNPQRLRTGKIESTSGSRPLVDVLVCRPFARRGVRRMVLCAADGEIACGAESPGASPCPAASHQVSPGRQGGAGRRPHSVWNGFGCCFLGSRNCVSVCISWCVSVCALRVHVCFVRAGVTDSPILKVSNED